MLKINQTVLYDEAQEVSFLYHGAWSLEQQVLPKIHMNPTMPLFK